MVYNFFFFNYLRRKMRSFFCLENNTIVIHHQCIMFVEYKAQQQSKSIYKRRSITS